MKRLTYTLSLMVLALALALTPSCGSDDDGTETPNDTTTDISGRQDIADQDQVEQDVVEDNTQPQDVVEDNTTPEDTTPEDVIDDTTPEDTTPEDIVEDMGSPDECGYAASIAGLLNCEEGDVDVMLDGVVVTYVYDAGFFVWDDSSTNGMQVYVGNEWPYDAPTVGDVINLHVIEYGSFYGTQEVTASDSIEKIGTGSVAEATLNIVTEDMAPNEAIEGRLVAGLGIIVTAVNGQNLTVSYGTQDDITLRVDDAMELCVGAEFDLSAGVITEYDGEHRIQCHYAAEDIVNVDTDGCPQPPEYDMSNWNFEENSETDPPADFEKADSDFTATSVSDPVHGGSVACQLTWTSDSNQDLYQGYYMPINAGSDVTFSFWALDNDAAGRIRPAMTFYDAEQGYIGNEYSNDYTTDSADWQEMTLTATAPAAAAFVRAYVRMYDVSADWLGTATVTIDDWSVTEAQ